VEMEKIARQSGFNGSVADFEKQLTSRPGMKFTSQEEMLTYARDVAMRVQPELPRLFKRLPRIPLGIRPISPDREAATASNYSRGTPDASPSRWVHMHAV